MKKKTTTHMQPVSPESMNLVFFYPCPGCKQQVPLLSPMQPGLAECSGCGTQFPIVPVDEKTVQYVRIMLGNGRAAVDADFM